MHEPNKNMSVHNDSMKVEYNISYAKLSCCTHKNFDTFSLDLSWGRRVKEISL